ncbi:MAG: hypothetical protein M9921_06100 [Fimbriimonadaceae bacterium]|nr:hypothetical protein [Fimbriimonadaceae bacterium]
MRWLAALCLVVAAGCQVDTPPDPNDPTQVGILQPEVLRRNLKTASDATMVRVEKGEITEQEGLKRIQQYAEDTIGTIDLDHIPVDKAWEYAEVFLAAKNWPLARAALLVAIQHPASEDRRVNDRLRLASAEAHLGHIPEAIAAARSVFDTPDEQAAPILLAVLYEIVPPAKGHGFDAELAQLLEDAITQHLRVRVDRRSEPGQAFLIARPFHLARAWSEIVRLYEAAGKPELAETAKERGNAMLRKYSPRGNR